MQPVSFKSWHLQPCRGEMPPQSFDNLHLFTHVCVRLSTSPIDTSKRARSPFQNTIGAMILIVTAAEVIELFSTCLELTFSCCVSSVNGHFLSIHRVGHINQFVEMLPTHKVSFMINKVPDECRTHVSRPALPP